MRVLFIHNRYQQAGGEDTVVKMEMDMLRENGNEVDLLEFNNDNITTLTDKLRAFVSSIYSFSTKRIVETKISETSYDVIHVHNFFPLVSPSVYDAAYKYKIPIVQTLHNYRIICPGALLMQDGKICEKCLKGNYFNAMIYKCYRNSILGSLSIALMDGVHRAINTWNNKINKVICLTEFAKNKFIEGGIDKNKLVVKPNFLLIKEDLPEEINRENVGLFVGRISEEKGINSLIEIHDKLKGLILIVGDGPAIDKLKGLSKFKILGRKSNKEVVELMRKSSFLLFPSIWYEGLPMTILEAFSNKLPVIATNIGAMKELIKDDSNGLHYNIGRSEEMAEKINWAFDNYEQFRKYGLNAYITFKESYSSEVNYSKQIEIYKQVINENKGK
ncbi:glycosyltransferase family 4 protein [Carboxylicivirga mesophila]|uniref:Glycosyltransferase family 4 protein n=1 Tax=Carboxylicivirga mesophila TaxID=1166478 RepID=A0ABS5K5G0_9BACT|nr:glycosyltransferase family 4 protein [Carboxylicivirga mesophila]MBS2210214.1 glycosyltransferase family 4 protein [Carboxylicivirga mesophila]